MINKSHVQYNGTNHQINTKNKIFLYVLKKAERLVAALEVLTITIGQEKEVLKRIKDKGYTALALIAELPLCEDPHLQREKIVYSILHLTSLLSIARDARVITQMNADLLVQEYQLLIATIQDASERLEGVILERDAMYVEPVDMPLRNTQKDIKISTRSTHTSSGTSIGPFSRIRAEKTLSVSSDTEKKIKSIEDRVDIRKRAIMDIIKRKGVVSIKDISTEIKDFSEKTIQRELLAMVESGVLTKEGERRWSTYKLA